MKKTIAILLTLLMLFTSCSKESVREVQKEEYTVKPLDVEYSMISYKLPDISEDYEIIKAYRNMLYILIHDTTDEKGDLVDKLIAYDFQSEKTIREYVLPRYMKIHDLMLYEGDIYISFGDGNNSFEDPTESEETEYSEESTSQEVLESDSEATESESVEEETESYFGRNIERLYFVGRLDMDGIKVIQSLDGQKFPPRFLYLFNEIYYVYLNDGVYSVMSLDEDSESEFDFDFADEIGDSIYSNGSKLMAQGKEGNDSYFYIVNQDLSVEKIPIEPTEQFFSFMGLKSGFFSSYTDIYDRENLKLMYIDIKPKGEESYKKKIISSDLLYKFYSNNQDDLVAVDSTGAINYIRIKRNQIYMGKIKGIGDNKYQILTNEDSRYGFVDMDNGVYLDIYFN